MRKMKNSGIKWIGEIPSEWKVIKCKHLIEVKSGDAIRNELLSSNGKYQVFGGGEILGYTDVCNANESNLLIGRVGARCGCVTRPFDKVFATDNALVVIPKSNRNFLYYVLISFDLNRLNTSNAQPLITSSKVKNITIPVPLVTTQQKIADFLDKKCSEIDSSISKTRETIEEYKKLKQSIITEAVTKGLNPNAKMKNSGIEWIGEIPESWEVNTIKYCSWLKGRIGWDGLKSTEYTDEGPFLITGTDFNKGIIKWNSCVHITKERFEEDIALHIVEDDLLISKDGTVGKVAIVKNCPQEVSLNSGVLLIRNIRDYKYDSKYMYYILNSNQFLLWFQLSQSGQSTIKHLYQEQFYQFKFSYPPISEQQQIADYLDQKCSEIDALITKKEQLVAELEAYKKSLIYEVVTGKREV